MIEKYIAGEQETIGRNDGDSPSPAFPRHGPADPQITPMFPELFDPRRANQFHEGKPAAIQDRHFQVVDLDERDRKSTRLNSSHQIISYAVFCLKKKKALADKRSARSRV